MKDSQITDCIRALFAAQKPEQISPTALLLTIRLLIQHADEKELNLSQGTLAEQLNCRSESTIKSALDSLTKAGWLVVRHRLRQQMPNAYSLKLDALPMDEDALKRTVPSDWARASALVYRNMMLRASPKRRFSKTALQRFAFVLETILNKYCKGDVKRMNAILSFALNSPKYRNEVLRGPHRLKHYWRSIIFDMEGQQ
jgi:hypothetical protein